MEQPLNIVNSITEDNNTLISVSPDSSKAGEISEQKENIALPKFSYGHKINVDKLSLSGSDWFSSENNDSLDLT